MSMEVEKSRDLPSASWTSRTVSARVQRPKNQGSWWCKSQSKAEDQCPSLRRQTESKSSAFPLSLPFVLLRSSIDWVTPTHIETSDFYYSLLIILTPSGNTFTDNLIRLLRRAGVVPAVFWAHNEISKFLFLILDMLVIRRPHCNFMKWGSNELVHFESMQVIQAWMHKHFLLLVFSLEVFFLSWRVLEVLS